jgi:quinol monooxygenase YgiN
MPTLLTVVAHIHAQPGKEDALREALLALIEPTRKEEGCVEYYLHEETGKPGHFVFYENWKSRAALDQHLATPHLSGLLPRVPELCSRPPEILTYTRLA